MVWSLSGINPRLRACGRAVSPHIATPRLGLLLSLVQLLGLALAQVDQSLMLLSLLQLAIHW